MIVKSIDTEWKGFLFRSRLEARWAMFFDACGADWEYEPEGFELDNGLRYLPDFRIRNVQLRCSGGPIPELFVEVKGVMSDLDAKKIEAFCDVGPSGGMGKHPLFVVGKFPTGNNQYEIFNQIANTPEDGKILFFNFETIDGDYFYGMPGVDKEGVFTIFGYDSNYCEDMDESRTIAAYNIARQARFSGTGRY